MNEKDAVKESYSYSMLEENIPHDGEMMYLNDLLQNDEVEERLNRIDSAITSFLGENGEPKILYDTARHLLVAGGKRLRSLLVILCCEAVGGDLEKALPFAVATEFAQTASLIHDDVVDEDTLRRGVDATHEKFGHKMAILAGDLLIAKAVKMIGNLATPDMIMQIAESGIHMCEGEASDMLLQLDDPEIMTKDSYLAMIEKKTVTFIKSAASMGASIGGCTQEQFQAMEVYGENLGYSFQIRDDILNIISTTEIAGKRVHSDLLSKRCTYPIVHALESSSTKQREECIKALSQGDLSVALSLINKTDAIPHAIELTRSYVEKAKRALDGHQFTNLGLLRQIADFVLQRLH